MAASLLAGIVLIAAWIALRPGSSYSKQDREQLFAASSSLHPAGTDGLGRDRLVRVAGALLLSPGGALAASAATTALAAGAGALAAFALSYLGRVVMLVCDVFLALPWLFLLMIVRSALPLTTSPGLSAAITFLVLAALGWPACARAVYRGALDMRQAEWMV
jgi:ABC-type dipeptide/oligopeptide/nickel transport system permease subunit